MSTEVMVRDYMPAPMTADEMIGQVGRIQEIMKAVMKENEHYGKIPGCGDKPTLLQPGAQKLVMTFHLVPAPDVTVVDLANGHREYRVTVRMLNRQGDMLGAGVGSCTTMESKYRYRTGPSELTDEPVPSDYWNLRNSDPGKAKAMLKGMVPKKNDAGRWVLAKQGEKVEHDNPADYYNTCEKMAFKRALVSATLTVTAASDIFTQDLEDLPPPPSPPVETKTEPVMDSKRTAQAKIAELRTEPPQEQTADFGSPNPPNQPGNQQDVPAAFIWKVGDKHRNESITTIPKDYLEWFAENGKNQQHVQEANLELDRRNGQGELLK